MKPKRRVWLLRRTDNCLISTHGCFVETLTDINNSAQKTIQILSKNFNPQRSSFFTEVITFNEVFISFHESMHFVWSIVYYLIEGFEIYSNILHYCNTNIWQKTIDRWSLCIINFCICTNCVLISLLVKNIKSDICIKR